jgi:hypothetical protein
VWNTETKIVGVFLAILTIDQFSLAQEEFDCDEKRQGQEAAPAPCIPMKTVEETCYREEQQETVIRCAKTITVEKQVPFEYTAWVRVKKVDIQEFEVKTPKFRWVEQKYTELVPGKEVVTRIRKRTECVPVKEMRTTIEDQGYWETDMVANESCGGCKCTEKKVWCSQMVEVTKEHTTLQEITFEEPYLCEVAVVAPIEKVRREKEYFTKTEVKTVKHPYETLEPRTRTKMITVCVPETVYEDKVVVRTVKKPYTVTREVPCEMAMAVPHEAK